MEFYQARFAEFLAETGALFFAPGLKLKDGRPTPYFVNMGMFFSGRLSNRLGSFYADLIKKEVIDRGTGIDIVCGPSYKGSAIAVAAASALHASYGIDVGFCYDRKEAKTHGEASAKSDLFVGSRFFDGCNVFIVDDVLTTAATKLEIIEKIRAYAENEGIKINIVGLGIGVDREQTTAVYDGSGNIMLNVRGRDPVEEFKKKTQVPVYAIGSITEIADHLLKKGLKVKGKEVITSAELELLQGYLAVYGLVRGETRDEK